MPCQIRIHHDLRLVYKKAWGTYGDAESQSWHAEWDAIWQAEAGVGDYNELYDLSQVTGYDVSIDHIRALADQYETEWRTGRHSPKQLAYVVPSPVAFGTGRVYGSLVAMTGIVFRVFKSLDEAADWLALTHDQRERVLETG